MAAKQHPPEATVYRFFGLIEGRPAFYTVDWHGVESPLRIVAEDERESDVIAELSDWLEATYPYSSSASQRDRSAPSPQPRLRLL